MRKTMFGLEHLDMANHHEQSSYGSVGVKTFEMDFAHCVFQIYGNKQCRD
jgi:hypothetical protein